MYVRAEEAWRRDTTLLMFRRDSQIRPDLQKHHIHHPVAEALDRAEDAKIAVALR